MNNKTKNKNKKEKCHNAPEYNNRKEGRNQRRKERMEIYKCQNSKKKNANIGGLLWKELLYF
jgi:hypothetical protein